MLPPDALFELLRRRYLSFFTSLQPEGVFFSGWQGLCVAPVRTCKRPIPLAAAQALASFLNEPIWVFNSRPQGPRTSWLQVVIEFLAIYGFFPGFLSPGMTARILVSRFRSYFLRICKGRIKVLPVTHVKTAAAVGMTTLSGFFGSMKCHHVHHQLYIFLQRAVDNSSNGTTWIPQFHDFSSIPPY